MTYQARLQAHRASYKRDTLRVRQPGIFRHRGVDVPKGHILPEDHAWLNLLELKRDVIRTYLEAHPEVRLHRYFHHLNSSQAFVFNLFVPYFEGGTEAATALLSALGQAGTLVSWQPESVPDSDEQTNLDAEWHTTDGVRTICEVKLSEREFGAATDDPSHRAKLREVYAPELRGHVEPALLEPATFFASYQILRNIWHMVRLEGTRLLFLLPRANADLWEPLQVILSAVRPPARSQVSVVATEDLLASLCSESGGPPEFRDYAHQLAAKYLIDHPATLSQRHA